MGETEDGKTRESAFCLPTPGAVPPNSISPLNVVHSFSLSDSHFHPRYPLYRFRVERRGGNQRMAEGRETEGAKGKIQTEGGSVSVELVIVPVEGNILAGDLSDNECGRK
jgi:hypothetical protein